MTNIIDQGMARIERDGWNSFRHDQEWIAGGHCIVTSMTADRSLTQPERTAELMAAYEAIAGVIEPDYERLSVKVITDYNGELGRSVEDVLLTMKRASVLLDSEAVG